MKEHQVQVDSRGLHLTIREWGIPNENHPSILLLHGFLEQSAAWDAVCKAMQPRHIVVPDHRGHGRSDHIGPGGFYHFWDYVADVDAVVEHFGFPVDLVGHSMGGTMAALYAATARERVRRLILIEGLGPPDGEARAVHQARVSLKHRRSPPTHRPITDLDDAMHRMKKGNPDVPSDALSALADRQTQSADNGLLWRWDALHRARAPVAFSERIFMEFLNEIQSPTMMIEGGRSPYQMIPGLDARRQAIPSSTQRVLDDSGHHPHHTHPGAIATLIQEHFDA